MIQLYRNVTEVSRADGGPGQLSPIAFNGCFGWFHGPTEGTQREVAVLICQGVMREASLAYCSMRQLADDLAAAGYPAMRFDYPAAGNSPDADLNESGHHWTAWQSSIDSAIEWLRGQGARRIVLCGLGGGATLASLVAARRYDIAGLLLFEPAIVGRSYIRQMILEADLQSGQSMPRELGLEIRENRFGPKSVEQIGAFDLRKLELRAGMKVAVFARPENRAVEECVKAWVARGAEASQHGFEGLHVLLHYDTLAEQGLGDFTRAISWLRQAVPPAAPSDKPVSLPVVVLQPSGCIDMPLKFGPENRLFGMLCRPERGSTEEMVLIPSGGREPSFGAARQNVMLARKLAQIGIASFRFDFAGLGDSLMPGNERTFSHAFTDRIADVRAAIDAMEALGFSRFTIHGLCLGAFHALHAAAVDPRLSSLVLINLPLFTVPTTNVLGQLEQRGRSGREYLGKLTRPSSWGNLLLGRSNLAAVTRGVMFHLQANTIGLLTRIARRTGLMSEQSFAHRAMATLSRRGARTLYLFSTGPEDIEAFAAEFGPDGAGLAGYPGAEMRVVPGMDHSLTITSGRVPAESMMIEFVLAERKADPAPGR
jgi:alpha-beta hydrolase superfamily lysophospholipase